ncbi:hypothetical protein M2137_000624 [Parabacteroides sp. PFB2-10]|uniref:DUF6383 domain-containing protein n=1 Tax=Parabacteroides sp. PFB2-10 TaxID=1742405 RepID=UPI00247579C3|nr:DUF6383 domain-containing protein [Parabacteroides sp. PFB2-10]MDH6311865.1 hypothetical protein [Parabacteroides sp. PFB2-10]MDL2244022.1 DUF6383 domain-containing protein [Parabacteroides sp. OttesenSCG-928-J18]
MNKKLFYVVMAGSLLMGSTVYGQFNPSATRAGSSSEWVMEFFRVNDPASFLYEDANSNYSKEKGMNYLGVESKGNKSNNAMIVKYTRGKIMPQYLVMLGKSIEYETEMLCSICHDPACSHSKEEVNYTSARFLVSLKDSVDYYQNNKAMLEKFLWNGYTRLAFVDGKLYGDSVLVIQNSSLPAKANRINVVDVDEKGEGKHLPVLFSFRLLSTDNEDGEFMIESHADRVGAGWAEWIKIQNGVPVLVETVFGANQVSESEVFDVVYSREDPVATLEVPEARIAVLSDYGTVTVKGAAGKRVTLVNPAGQVIISRRLASDETVISAPAGVVIVSIDDQFSTKVLVK